MQGSTRPTSKCAYSSRISVLYIELPLCVLVQKQGVLPLWFANKDDYALIGSGDIVETVGLEDVSALLFSGQLRLMMNTLLQVIRGVEGATIRLKVTKRQASGETVSWVETKHTMSADQLRWLRAGSALNYIRDLASST